VTFTPENGFEGIAYFNYLAKDAAGSTELGQVSVQVIDTENQETTEEIFLATLNTRPLRVLLPGSDFVLDTQNEPQHGSINYVGTNQLIYIPEIDFEGRDTFMFANNDQERFYFLEIYDIPNDGLAVVDDEVFTMENEEVVFNVNENDYKDNYMDEWTQPLHGYVNYLGNGDFSYLPDEDYHGYDEFTYTKRVAPIVFQTAKVRIGVGNFRPLAMEQYDLNTLKNQAVLINYNIPVDDFSFEIIYEPDFGTLDYYEGYQTITIGCDVVSGYNMLVYIPGTDFSGLDEFEIDYCPADATCQLVKLVVDVFDEVFDPNCPCVGADCVWKGDTNNDGVVDVRDLLPVGLFMGYEGDQRSFDTNNWLGLNAPEWAEAQVDNGINLKHVDADGNGIIEAIDTAAISANYENLHTILPKGVNAYKPFPIFITTEQDTVYEGDWLNLTIGIGDENNPVVDISGFTYSFQFPPELIEASSLQHAFFEESWFANASSTLQMDKQPLEGKLDAGFTRIGGIGISGHGPVAKCDFIVEDDIEGLKLKSDIIPITLKLDGGTVLDQYGGSYLLPSSEKTIYLNLRGEPKAPVVDELKLYPNPAGDYLNVHLNGQNEFNTIQVYTSTGMLIDNHRFNMTNHSRIDVNNYKPGVYFIVVETIKGKTAQRFEVIR